MVDKESMWLNLANKAFNLDNTLSIGCLTPDSLNHLHVFIKSRNVEPLPAKSVSFDLVWSVRRLMDIKLSDLSISISVEI